MLLKQYEKYLLSLQQDLERREKTAVPGRLHVSSSGNRTQFYQRSLLRTVNDDQTISDCRAEKYLSASKDFSLIQALAQQDYDRDLARGVNRHLTAIRTAGKALPDSGLEDIYTNQLSTRKSLITPLVPDRERFIKDWDAVTWVPKGFDKNAPEFYSVRDERVRSKSEKIIADYYDHLTFHYRYECPLTLKNGSKIIVLHPDFTVLNLRTLQEIYHEHLGRLDDPGYMADVQWRLGIYMANGIFPGENLFFTTETGNKPFNTAQLDLMIRRYLL